MDNKEQQALLNEVIIVRLVLILLVVFYHAFAIYSGAWEREYTPPHIAIYEWLDRFSYACMLESFVFISGYIVGFQTILKGQKIDIKKKIVRLLVPSIVFSFVYWMMFKSSEGISLMFFYDLLEGVAHMWFLPMLFWCFVLLRVFKPIIDKHFITAVIISIFLAIISFIPLPFRINLTFYYFPFFLAGYAVWKRKSANMISGLSICIAILAFILTFVGFTLLSKHLNAVLHTDSIMNKITCVGSETISKLIYSIIGVYLIYQFMIYFRVHKIVLPIWMIKISECCFGVYLFQQFALVYLYDYTNIPYNINPYLLPWCMLSITLFFSVLFTFVLRQTSLGKRYI